MKNIERMHRTPRLRRGFMLDAIGAGLVIRDVRRTRMEVSVTIDLSVVPQAKHVEQMRSAARSLTNDRSRVQITCPPTAPSSLDKTADRVWT